MIMPFGHPAGGLPKTGGLAPLGGLTNTGGFEPPGGLPGMNGGRGPTAPQPGVPGRQCHGPLGGGGGGRLPRTIDGGAQKPAAGA